MPSRIKVDPNRPLPPSVGKEYWETAAKLILEHFYPDRFVDLSVDGERPDLRNGMVGVEVTSAESSISKRIDSLHAREYTYGNIEQRESAERQITKLGGVIKEFGLVHPIYNHDLDMIYSSVRKKTRKLNKYYQIFNENDLFIYSTDYIVEDEFPMILDGIIKSMSGYGRKFDSVFLCCLGGDLCEFNIRSGSYEYISGSHDAIQQLTIDARKLIDLKYS